MAKKLSPEERVIEIFTKAENPQAESLLNIATALVKMRRPKNVDKPKRGRPTKVAAAPVRSVETEVLFKEGFK